MRGTSSEPTTKWQRYLRDCRTHIKGAYPLQTQGRLTRVAGMVMEAVGLKLPVGSSCHIIQDGVVQTEAEVVGFSSERLFLMPVQNVYGLAPGALVRPISTGYPAPVFGKPARQSEPFLSRAKHLPMGAGLLGRVLDATGEPLDGLGALDFDTRWPLHGRPINPIGRMPITLGLDVGVRALNALLTIGRGQRMGLFAASGVGKSVLLGMMARYTSAEVIVVGLIGERGREVREFIEHNLGPGLSRAVVIAAPADTPPLLRLQGAAYATAVAEYFRDQGRQVLLIMDSLTRFAMAQREVALAIGELPATKGYPPSVFARLPQLVERAGNGETGKGSITAFYTVLVEGDDEQDPIGDSARAILDGHIVLSRELAEQGLYPAINIEASISRVMHNVASPEHLELAKRFKQLYSRFQKNRDLLNVGAYISGADPMLDKAIAVFPQLEAYLQQAVNEQAGLAQSVQDLALLLGPAGVTQT